MHTYARVHAHTHTYVSVIHTIIDTHTHFMIDVDAARTVFFS